MCNIVVLELGAPLCTSSLWTAGAMEALAQAYSKEDIGRMGYNLYEKFRPAVPEGGRGWGAKGLLDLSHLAQLTQDVTT